MADHLIPFLKKPVHRSDYSDPCPCSCQRAKHFVIKSTPISAGRSTHVFDILNTKLVEFGTGAFTQCSFGET